MTTGTMRLRELTIRYSAMKDGVGHPICVNRRIGSASDCAALLSNLLRDEAAEVFAILCLSTKHRLIAYHEVSRGALDATLVHPREVFKAALLANAAAIILAHNHPSGDPTPSPDDLALTQRLVHAGQIIGIDVLDHVIVGDGLWTSFLESGRISPH